MGDPWMNDCLAMYIEKYVANRIDNKVIMQRFQNMKKKKIQNIKGNCKTSCIWILFFFGWYCYIQVLFVLDFILFMFSIDPITPLKKILEQPLLLANKHLSVLLVVFAWFFWEKINRYKVCNSKFIFNSFSTICFIYFQTL